MKPENLESLLLDRALGQLSPEVADLLEAHLATEPLAARRAESLGRAVGQARHAVTVMTDLPAQAGRNADAAWRRARRTVRWRAAARDALKLAAGLAIGIGLAWFGRSPAPTASSFAVAMPVESRPANHGAPVFWSTARLAREAQRAGERTEALSNRYESRWLSPAKLPQLEGKL